MNVKGCEQQLLQIFLVVIKKELYRLAIVFFCIKLPV